MTVTPPIIFLATPCYGGQAHAAYMNSLLALLPLCAAQGVSVKVDVGGGEALIGRGRAGLMAKFLASDASHLLFVDADVGFEADKALRLLRSGFDLVGGVYPRKHLRLGQAPDLELEPLPGAPPERDGFRQAATVGCGFLMISRAAAQRLHDGFPQLHARLGDVLGARDGLVAMVFDSFPDPDTGRYLADHQALCRRWRDLGGEVWADMTPGLTHVGDVMLATA